MAPTSAGQTWTAMPAALTEIFNDATAQHEILFDQFFIGQNNTVTGPIYIVTASFWAIVTTCSTTATAVLRPEVSSNIGTPPWFELARATGTLDLQIGTQGTCGAFPIQITGIDNPVSINLANILATDTVLRVVGIGGNGVSSPTFTEIGLTLFISIQHQLLCGDQLSTLQSNLVQISINCNGVVSSFTPAVGWTGL
jgi:hypothetical protein